MALGHLRDSLSGGSFPAQLGLDVYLVMFLLFLIGFFMVLIGFFKHVYPGFCLRCFVYFWSLFKRPFGDRAKVPYWGSKENGLLGNMYSFGGVS